LSKKEYNNSVLKKTKNTKLIKATAVSILVVAVFAVFQVMEFSNGATDQVTLSLTVNEALALDCGADVNIGSLTPGTPAYNSSTCTVGTNSNDGYNLQVKRDDANTTMDLTTDAAVNIADKTAWDPSGSGNAATWSGTGLGFGIYASTATKSTTWWGTGTTCDPTDSNNKFAGFPSSYANIMEHPTYESSDTTTSICYSVDTAATQQAGSYNGTITYQAIGTP
jgi:hypothetical protein